MTIRKRVARIYSKFWRWTKKYENLVNRVKAPIYVMADTKRLAIRMSASLTMILIIEPVYHKILGQGEFWLGERFLFFLVLCILKDRYNNGNGDCDEADDQHSYEYFI